jgi:hypothetical protein
MYIYLIAIRQMTLFKIVQSTEVTNPRLWNQSPESDPQLRALGKDSKFEPAESAALSRPGPDPRDGVMHLTLLHP